MIPSDMFEKTIIDCFLICRKSNPLGGHELDSLIVKEFSKKNKIDFIELVQILKSMIGELNCGIRKRA